MGPTHCGLRGATHLLNDGFSLKEVGDHLATYHRCHPVYTKSTWPAYAKSADFDLRWLVAYTQDSAHRATPIYPVRYYRAAAVAESAWEVFYEAVPSGGKLHRAKRSLGMLFNSGAFSCMPMEAMEDLTFAASGRLPFASFSTAWGQSRLIGFRSITRSNPFIATQSRTPRVF